MSASPPRILDGVRVVELGQLLAGPFCGTVLGYFGAEVIKVEPPAGDPIRTWRVTQDGTSLWWYSLGRNKKSIVLDLRKSAGRDAARRLIQSADVLVENFRPGTLERWGLGPDTLRESNPELVVARISGYGQTGPYAHRPGYASVCEGFGGLRYVTGMPGEPPVRSNLSIGDTLAGVHAALGVVLSLLGRARGTAPPQTVDVGIFEAVFNMLEGVIPEYDGADVVREPSGTTVTGIVPTNIYRCRNQRWVIIGANGESNYRRLMRAAGRGDLADDPRMADNQGRVEHQEELDRAIEAWTSTLTVDEVVAILENASVPAGPILNAAEIVADPQYNARGLFETVEVGGRPLRLPAIVPKLSATPGGTRWPGPKLGEHTAEVLGGLGLSEEEIAAAG